MAKILHCVKLLRGTSHNATGVRNTVKVCSQANPNQ